MVEGEEVEPTALAMVIRGLMDERGMDAQQLAASTGLGLSTIYAYLRGRQRGTQPQTRTFEALARALGVDPALLYDAAERSDARGEQRLLQYFHMLPTREARAEAINAVRDLVWQHRRRSHPPG